jgi:hypothetical protein
LLSRLTAVFGFQSTLPVWGATRPPLHLAHTAACFNPRSPCGERPPAAKNTTAAGVFQSTLPVWGATRRGVRGAQGGCRFNPRSPCGERPPPATLGAHGGMFQSTLPVWGATSEVTRRGVAKRFQSTLPVWGATGLALDLLHRLAVSIHAPRVGSDRKLDSYLIISGKVSIHAPRVGSDVPAMAGGDEAAVSIHAPRVGSDIIRQAPQPGDDSFNPRSPCGERQRGQANHQGTAQVSIHAPRVGSDAWPG